MSINQSVNLHMAYYICRSWGGEIINLYYLTLADSKDNIYKVNNLIGQRYFKYVTLKQISGERISEEEAKAIVLERL